MNHPRAAAESRAHRGAVQDRIVSVSAAPYDGYPWPRLLESLAAIGATHVEPVYALGSAPFDESVFDDTHARQVAGWLRDHGVACHALSAHLDLGRGDAVELLRRRMDFARRIGARIVNSYGAAREHERSFLTNLAVIARHAESLDLHVGLEASGERCDELLARADDAVALVRRVGHPRIGLNHDTGNVLSRDPGADPVREALTALPACVHVHLKDVRASADGYFHVPLGSGDAGCADIVRALAATPLDCSIELPLRQHRSADGHSSRSVYRVPLADIERTLAAGLRFVAEHLRPHPESDAARATAQAA